MSKLLHETQDVLALIMAGGKGSRLKSLTEIRSKPAMYFGGKYRIIDFVLSNCFNSNIKKIAVITQYKSHSLIRHLFNAWGFLNKETQSFMEILPASQQIEDTTWYRGTADSVAQNLFFIKHVKPKYTLILAGDHIYKMDYSIMLEKHIKSGAKCTVGCVVVPKIEAKGFGVMDVDKNNKIISFVEKPENPPTLINDSNSSLASMGIYLFNTDYLEEKLFEDLKNNKSSHDFGKDIIPNLVNKGEAFAHSFPESCVKSSPDAPNYWKDVGTVGSYWEANIELTNTLPSFDLYDLKWNILSFQSTYQPSKYIFNDEGRRGYATDSLVSAGCIISGGHVNKSVIFNSVRVNSYSKINECVILPNVNIGRHARIQKAIIEKNSIIPEGLVVGENPIDDQKNFYRSEDGIVIITPEMLEKMK